VNRGHCQICGRARPLRADGSLRGHYVAGNLCAGAGFLPIEVSDDRLRGCVAEMEAELASLEEHLKALREQRVNRIDPCLQQRWLELRSSSRRLLRRIRRLENWPERHKRQMEQYGYTLECSPPAYLLARVEGWRCKASLPV